MVSASSWSATTAAKRGDRRGPQGRFARSQRQARSAKHTYRWIESLPADRPVDLDLIKQIHARIVTGCDDDHCAPGTLRGSGQNVVFGRPRHCGVEGGADCARAFSRLCGALNQEFRAHDTLVQALAFHYHLGAMHPFHDGNGRTARAVEALLLRRSQLKDSLFIAMSNYYYDEKDKYLYVLSKVREENYDLTPFLKFGLRGIAVQCQRLLKEIRVHVQRSLFRDVMAQMYGRLQSTRKRALAHRQCEILNVLLDRTAPIDHIELYDMVEKHYTKLAGPIRAYIRDLNYLTSLEATSVGRINQKIGASRYDVSVRLDWATEITETEFYRHINKLPEAKTRLAVSSI